MELDTIAQIFTVAAQTAPSEIEDSMDITALAQIFAMLLAALGIVWRIQRTTDKLRDDLTKTTDKLAKDIGKLRKVVTKNGERLARLEGLLSNPYFRRPRRRPRHRRR